MNRPPDLPDFEDPPLHEVVLGVQFATPRGFQQIFAGEVWELYRKDFPKVGEQPALPPSFETFGLTENQQFNFGFLTGAIPNRYWFLSANGDELIQFQSDRLLHNWRKVGDETNPYPRFESMIEKFEDELSKLEFYFTRFGSEKLNINQCELTYVNEIIIADSQESSVENWLNLVNLKNIGAEGFKLEFKKAIKDTQGNPYGRLICEASTTTNKKNEPIISLNLTVRGAPQESNIKFALDLLRSGRELIVVSFDEVTTDFAHKKWSKK